jgi:hypothetical protein
VRAPLFNLWDENAPVNDVQTIVIYQCTAVGLISYFVTEKVT